MKKLNDYILDEISGTLEKYLNINNNIPLEPKPTPDAYDKYIKVCIEIAGEHYEIDTTTEIEIKENMDISEIYKIKKLRNLERIKIPADIFFKLNIDFFKFQNLREIHLKN